MATLVSTIETLARERLVEPVPLFWQSQELVDIISAGVRDLWRDIVDLKQEHFLTINSSDVTLPANTSTLAGLPSDVHKVYLIEPADLLADGAGRNLVFKPLDYNHPFFQQARASSAIEPANGFIYYAITSQGGPVGAPAIYVAPQITSTITLSVAYVPTLPALSSTSTIPIPAEVDNALIAWTVAFARAKERENRTPDPEWLKIYSTEKAHILESLGLRQYHEAQFAEAVFEEYW